MAQYRELVKSIDWSINQKISLNPLKRSENSGYHTLINSDKISSVGLGLLTDKYSCLISLHFLQYIEKMKLLRRSFGNEVWYIEEKTVCMDSLVRIKHSKHWIVSMWSMSAKQSRRIRCEWLNRASAWVSGSECWWRRRFRCVATHPIYGAFIAGEA